jgi:hypothetical protein
MKWQHAYTHFCSPRAHVQMELSMIASHSGQAHWSTYSNTNRKSHANQQPSNLMELSVFASHSGHDHSNTTCKHAKRIDLSMIASHSGQVPWSRVCQAWNEDIPMQCERTYHWATCFASRANQASLYMMMSIDSSPLQWVKCMCQPCSEYMWSYVALLRAWRACMSM